MSKIPQEEQDAPKTIPILSNDDDGDNIAEFPVQDEQEDINHLAILKNTPIGSVKYGKKGKEKMYQVKNLSLGGVLELTSIISGQYNLILDAARDMAKKGAVSDLEVILAALSKLEQKTIEKIISIVLDTTEEEAAAGFTVSGFIRVVEAGMEVEDFAEILFTLARVKNKLLLQK